MRCIPLYNSQAASWRKAIQNLWENMYLWFLLRGSGWGGEEKEGGRERKKGMAMYWTLAAAPGTFTDFISWIFYQPDQAAMNPILQVKTLRSRKITCLINNKLVKDVPVISETVLYLQMSGSQIVGPNRQQQLPPPGNSLERQILWTHLRPSDSQTTGVRLNNLYFNKPSRFFWHTLKSENTCSRAEVNIFCKGPERKYVQLCRPDGLCCKYSPLLH